MDRGDLDIELAADRGVTIDAAMTGRSGSAVSPDDIEAVRWFRLAAEQGHAGAQYNLGVLKAGLVPLFPPLPLDRPTRTRTTPAARRVRRGD